MAQPIRIGTLLHGYCGGLFGRDNYNDKRVEAIGADWIVARDVYGQVLFAEVKPEDLLEYTIEPPADLRQVNGQ
jgi:hypothetical protein